MFMCASFVIGLTVYYSRMQSELMCGFELGVTTEVRTG